MTDLLFETLQAYDPTALASIVRQSQRDPDFEIIDWTVRPLGHEILIETTGGLFCFSGSGKSGNQVRPWSIIMKSVLHPQGEIQSRNSIEYCKREVEAFQSGLLANLPAGIRAPHFYGLSEYDTDTWLWMEHIQESTVGLWSLDRFYRAARRLGRFSGAYLVDKPLPGDLWLCSNFYREIYTDSEFDKKFMNPETDESVWKLPIIQHSFDKELRSRFLRIYSEVNSILNANDRLPQVLCHNDAHRRNLMWTVSPETGQEDLVAIDWALMGPGALGNDLGEAIATSLYFFEYDINDAETLETTMLDGYLAGLAEAGWSGDSQLAHLGYLISAILRKATLIPYHIATTLPPEAGMNVQAIYHRSAEEVLAGWMQLELFLLDRADEVRSLLKQLAL